MTSTGHRRSVAAWIVYDLANTIFALGVAGLYFPVWVVSEQGFPDSAISLSTAAAMGVVILTAPWIGARSDASGRRIPWLRGTTVLAVAATASLASLPVIPSLFLFSLALIGFHLGSVIYDSLLPDVSRDENRGWISGLGVGAGYIGSFVAVGIGTLIRPRFGFDGVFQAIALLFMLFAIPAFFLIREPARSTSGQAPGLRQALTQVIRSWRRARRFPGVTSFLVGRFLYTDAINTVIIFLAVFAIEEVGFTTEQVEILLPLAITGAVIGGVLGGRLVDRVGVRRTLHAALYVWMAALVVGITAALARLEILAWILGPVGGMALGTTGASDRVYMARISPPRFLGELYGLYATVGRFATVLGPLAWALLVDVLGWGREAAMGSLLVFLVAARAVLGRVDDERRQWGLDEV